MKSVMLLSGIGMGIALLFSCGVRPSPEPAPMREAPPVPIEEVSPPPSIWELVIPAGQPGGPRRRVLTAAEVKAYVDAGHLKLDGDPVQAVEVGHYSRVGPRRHYLVRKPAPLAADLR